MHLNGTSFTPVPTTGNHANLYKKEHETLDKVYLVICNLYNRDALRSEMGERPIPEALMRLAREFMRIKHSYRTPGTP